MSRLEIVSKTGNLKLGVIDELAGTVEITEEWQAILDTRKPPHDPRPQPKAPDEEEDEDDDDEEDEE